MNDPISSIMSQFQSFMRNPAQFLIQSRLPQNALQNPAQAVQQLMNSGQMSQQQFNQLQSMAKQIQSNPMFNQIIGRK